MPTSSLDFLKDLDSYYFYNTLFGSIVFYKVLNNSYKTVKFLSPALEIFVPIGNDETVTMLGLWFDAVGHLNIYVQQAVVPDNVFAQVKIITLKVPIAIGFTVFNLGLALFFARSSILGLRNAVNEIRQSLSASH